MPGSSSANRLSDADAWVIAADTREGFGARLREIWYYRRILAFFSIKSIQSLYAKTRLGMPWIFIRTLFPLVVGSLVFGGVMDVPSGAVPYFIFFAVGQLAWNCFDGPLIRGSRGIDVNRELLRKLYIPRIILPMGQMTAGLVEPAIITLVLIGSVFYYHAADGVWYVQPGLALFRSALAVALILWFAFSLSLFTSLWQARARDVRFVLRHVMGFWLLFTPVIWPLSMAQARLPAGFGWLFYLNPMTAPVEMFKSGILPGTTASVPWFGYSATVTLVVFLTGLWHFSRTESATMDTL
jgi:lipopolysaccharide transport system permease protein